MRFGNKLRQHRLAAALTQEALADRAKVSVNTIIVLETGRRLPRLSTAKLLAEALDLDGAVRDCFLSAALGDNAPTAPAPAPAAGGEPEPGEPAPPDGAPADPAAAASSPPDSIGVHRQLPADLATFTGRADVLARLLETATRPHPGGVPTVVVSSIEGMAGVGKTRLALRAAHELVRAGHYTDMQLFVDLRGFDAEAPPADPAAVLESFLRQLGIPSQQIPADTAERAAMFRDRMHDKNALIVLDNAADEQQIRDLIPAAPSCLVLVTSRRSLAALDGAVLHKLDVFAEEEALSLLTGALGADRVAAEPQAAAELVRACGYLPLAVSLVGARLRSRPTWTIGKQIFGLGRSLTAEGGGRSLQRVFEMSYHSLSPETRSVFRLLGIHIGRDFTAASVGALSGLGAEPAREVLEVLLDEHLVQQTVEDRFQLHDLVREYAAQCAAAELDAAARAAAMERLLRWYAASTEAALDLVSPTWIRPPDRGPIGPATFEPFADVSQAADWYFHESATLVEAAEEASRRGLHQAAWRLSNAIISHEQHRDPGLAQRLSLSAISSARRARDLEAEGYLLIRYGNVLTTLGDFKEAIRVGREALAILQSTGASRYHGVGSSLLAFALAEAGHPEEGLALATEVLATARRDGDDRAEMSALNGIADSLHRLGRSAEAVDHLKAAITVAERRQDALLIVMAYRNLGYTYQTMDRPAEALSAFESAIGGSRASGTSYFAAECHIGVAWAYRRLGREEAAAEADRVLAELVDSLPPADSERYRQQLKTSTLHGRREEGTAAAEEA